MRNLKQDDKSFLTCLLEKILSLPVPHLDDRSSLPGGNKTRVLFSYPSKHFFPNVDPGILKRETLLKKKVKSYAIMILDGYPQP